MKVLTFGEVMLRLKTPEHLKILQADTFEANYGGAEANVAVSLATLADALVFTILKRERISARRAWFMTALTAQLQWQRQRNLTGKNCLMA